MYSKASKLLISNSKRDDSGQYLITLNNATIGNFHFVKKSLVYFQNLTIVNNSANQASVVFLENSEIIVNETTISNNTAVIKATLYALTNAKMTV